MKCSAAKPAMAIYGPTDMRARGGSVVRNEGEVRAAPITQSVAMKAPSLTMARRPFLSSLSCSSVNFSGLFLKGLKL